jgi:hypothetical protein
MIKHGTGPLAHECQLPVCYDHERSVSLLLFIGHGNLLNSNMFEKELSYVGTNAQQTLVLKRRLHVHVHVHNHTHTHTHTHKSTQIHTHVHTNAHQILMLNRHLRVHVHVRNRTHAQMHTQIHTCARTHRGVLSGVL